MQLNAGASAHAIENAISSIGHALPSDYLDFLREHNGGEGFVGGNYLILWKAEELHDFNCNYEVAKYVPGLIIFASSGGGAGYGFDTRDSMMPIVSVEFIGMNWAEADRIADNFAEFLRKLSE